MQQLYTGKIEEDLLKLGYPVDGFWDEALHGWGTRFKGLEEDISELLGQNGFSEKEQILNDSNKVIVYNDGFDSGIIQLINYHKSKVWKNSKLIGFGEDSKITLVFDALEKFYKEKPKFTVERS